MRMTYRDRERIGGIGRGAGSRQQHADHCGNLGLLGTACPHDTLLDQPGRIFGDRQAGLRRREQSGCPRVAQLHGRRHIVRQKSLLDRGFVRPVRRNEIGDGLEDMVQPDSQRGIGRRLHHAMRDGNEAAPIDPYYAPARVPKAGIDTENGHR